MQNATDLKLFAPKIFDLEGTLLLKFFKLILTWRSNISPNQKKLNFEARLTAPGTSFVTLFEQ